MQDIWGDNEVHCYHFVVSEEISKFFEKLWNDKRIPEKFKLTLGREQYFKIIRLPWFNIAILNGSIMSLTQLDDLIDAIDISNKEHDKQVEEINEESAKYPLDYSKGCIKGEILTYYKDASHKLIHMANPTEEDCKK